jgi:hypothetical protein
MYKHFEERFPGREKQLEQLGNITMGVGYLLYCQTNPLITKTNTCFIYRLNQQTTHLKVYLSLDHLLLEKQQ